MDDDEFSSHMGMSRLGGHITGGLRSGPLELLLLPPLVWGWSNSSAAGNELNTTSVRNLLSWLHTQDGLVRGFPGGSGLAWWLVRGSAGCSASLWLSRCILAWVFLGCTNLIGPIDGGQGAFCSCWVY